MTRYGAYDRIYLNTGEHLASGLSFSKKIGSSLVFAVTEGNGNVVELP
jgi:hypothetical protein